MTVATAAFFLQVPPDYGLGTAGVISAPQALSPEGPPSILWGQGTPNGDLAPFNRVNKGSLYMSVNQTDDTGASLWTKVDEGGDDADWEEVWVDGQALIDLSNLTEAARVEAQTSFVVLPTEVDISASDSEVVEFHAVAALTIAEIGLIWNEATEASNPAEGDVTIGTASGGAQIVAATPYAISAAVGDYQALSLVTGAMTAGQSLFISHDQAASATGLYKVMVKFSED